MWLGGPRVAKMFYFKNYNHQEDQCNPFHTQVAGDIICPLQNLAWSLMALVQIKVFKTILKQCIIVVFKRITMHFHLYFKRGAAIFLFLGFHFRIRRRRRSSIVRHAFIRWSRFFRYHFKTLQFIKTLKKITKTVDFGIPTIKIFLNKTIFGVQ